jgi:hypothetical protein
MAEGLKGFVFLEKVWKEVWSLRLRMGFIGILERDWVY